MLTLTQLSPLLEQAKPTQEETFDIRFEKIVSLVEQEKFAEAIPIIETILKEGCIDIRLVIYLAYAHFLESGIKSFIDIFPVFQIALNEHWEKISPLQGREKHTHSSLAWFFSLISKKLKRTEKLYKDKRPDDFWNKATETLSEQDFENIQHLTQQLADLITTKWKQSSLQQHLMFISKWLKDFSSILVSEKKETEQIAEEQSINPEKENTTPINPIPEKKPQPEASNQLSPLENILLSSEPMKLLFYKIQTFEKLIDQQNFTKAALVSNDITHLIENFDPSVYFPKLFSRYFALIAQHIDVLSQEWEGKTTPKWQSLQRLYHHDIEEFIKW